jgi:archaemetzincin
MVKRSPFKSLATILFTLYAVQIAMAEPENPQVLPSTDSAVGALDDLPAHRARAFQITDHFDPLPPPGPGDWLAEHPEPGQTFEQFLRARPHRPDALRSKLYLLPLGEFPPHRSPAINRLREFAAAFFSLEVTLLPPLDLDTAAIEGRRNPHTGQFQLDARAVLRLLRRRLPTDAFALLGITMVDLYPDPNWNFVFGLASPSNHVGVFSFARYDPGFYGETASHNAEDLLLRRSCKVLAHEIAHMFGIAHCVFFNCLMNGSNHLAESDARPLHLCPVDLRKLQHSTGFESETRYRRLLDFSRNVGFDEESAWLEKRLRYVDGF